MSKSYFLAAEEVSEYFPIVLRVGLRGSPEVASCQAYGAMDMTFAMSGCQISLQLDAGSREDMDGWGFGVGKGGYSEREMARTGGQLSICAGKVLRALVSACRRRVSEKRRQMGDSVMLLIEKRCGRLVLLSPTNDTRMTIFQIKTVNDLDVQQEHPQMHQMFQSYSPGHHSGNTRFLLPPHQTISSSQIHLPLEADFGRVHLNFDAKRI